MPLDEDDEHARYDPDQVASYFAAATRAALVLAAFRAPYRGPLDAGQRVVGLVRPRREPVLRPAGRSRRQTTSSCATRWMRRRSPSAGGRATPRYGKAAFYAYAHPAPEGFADATLSPPAARWDAALGLYVLDWDDVRSEPDPHAVALEFARSAFRHSCAVCDWDPALPASAEGTPPPIR